MCKCVCTLVVPNFAKPTPLLLSWLQVEGELGLSSTNGAAANAAENSTLDDAQTVSQTLPANVAVVGSRTNYTEAVDGRLKQRHPALAAPAGVDDVGMVS